ncbi:MAG: transposase [Pelagimonas sp.]|uniref:transposase n=1 Tax=Pelagimonas sp. TaxID=2073170 RepID=UPI003D6AFE7D
MHPPKKNRKETIDYCKKTYKTQHKVENLFAKLKDWRRIATRYDRCALTFKSAIYLAATIIFCLSVLTQVDGIPSPDHQRKVPSISKII